MKDVVMRFGSILCFVFWAVLLTVWGPSVSQAKPLTSQEAKDSELRQQILIAVDRLLEKRLQEKETRSTMSDDASAQKENIRQKKQDEPSPFFGGDYDYTSRSKKAWLAANRQQDEPSPIFPDDKWNYRSKKSEVSNELIDKLIEAWKMEKAQSQAKRARTSNTADSEETENILDLLGRHQ